MDAKHKYKIGHQSANSATVALGFFIGGHEEKCAEVIRRYNAHDDLVAALEAMAEHWHHVIGLASPAEWHRLNEQAHAALAKAKGE